MLFFLGCAPNEKHRAPDDKVGHRKHEENAPADAGAEAQELYRFLTALKQIRAHRAGVKRRDAGQETGDKRKTKKQRKRKLLLLFALNLMSHVARLMTPHALPSSLSHLAAS